MNDAKFFNVQSESDPDKQWIVRLMPDGSYRCDCPQFVFKKGQACKHILKIWEQDENATN